MVTNRFLSATIQFKPVWGKPELNRERILEILRGAAAAGAKLAVLPEMCISGYIFRDANEILPFCEPSEGETFRLISNACKENGIFVVYGFAEKCGEKLYNSQSLVAPDGTLVATYRKTHLYESDCTWATPGNTGFLAIDTELGKLGLGICMDLNFQDFTDFHILQGTQIICFSTCWLDENFPIAAYWLYRLAGYENTILIANSFGDERGTHFRGESAVIDGGALVQQFGIDAEGVLLTEHEFASQ